MVNVNKDSKDFSRRKFLKGGLALGAVAGLATVAGGKETKEVAQAFGKKQLDNFPHEIGPDFKRFDQKRTCFTRGKMDPILVERVAPFPPLNSVTDNSQPGNTELDLALQKGAWNVSRVFGNGHNSPLYNWNLETKENKYEFASKEEASKAIKKAAKFYGADLVGITPYDEKWVYDPLFSRTGDVYDSEFPFKPKSVIAIAVEMDYEVMSSAPTQLSDASIGLGYSNMAEVSFKLSTFINELGYKAFSSGNDTAESVPYAIAAGLGELGRQGLLVTYEYGPRVRLCKVFTEMELAYDKPIKFGANDFCKVCKKCAYSCPSQSISHEDEMTFEPEISSPSNHTGVKKYYVDVESCLVYWVTGSNSCGVCITSCPFNKPDFWHHRITTALTATPLKPFLNEMDDLFGYGDIFNEKVCTEFWSLENYPK